MSLVAYPKPFNKCGSCTDYITNASSKFPGNAHKASGKLYTPKAIHPFYYNGSTQSMTLLQSRKSLDRLHTANLKPPTLLRNSDWPTVGTNSNVA